MTRAHRPSLPFRAVALAAALAWPSLLPAQVPEGEGWEPVETFGEQVSVDVVNVEVWVTDRDGEPVTGLAAEDFQLLEDGEPVEIRYFTEFGGAADPWEATDAGAQPAGDGDAPAPEAALSDEELLRVVVFVDDWNLRPEDRARVLDDLRAFLARELRPGEEVMAAVHRGTSLQIVQPFTADHQVLSRALDRVERGSAAGVQLRTDRRQAYREINDAYEAVVDLAGRVFGEAPDRTGDDPGADPLDPCVNAWPDMENAFRSYAASVASHAQGSVSAVAAVLQSLAGVPGSKVLLYVGNGLPDVAAVDVFEYIRGLCPHRESRISHLQNAYDLNPLYDQVVERANAHGVTLYTLEGESPAEDPETEPTQLRYRKPIHVTRMREQSLEATLSRMAAETGGRAILDTADFGPAFSGIGRDLRQYYSLGFAPSRPGDGRQHRLQVRVPGQRLRVRHRTSYLDKPWEQRLVERVYGVAGLASERNLLQARVETGEIAEGAGGLSRVPLRIWVPLESVTLIPADGGAAGSLRVVLAVSEGGTFGPVRQKLVPVLVGELAEGQTTPGQKLIEVNLDLPAGEHQVALGIRDELAAATSYLRHDIRVGVDSQASLEP